MVARSIRMALIASLSIAAALALTPAQAQDENPTTPGAIPDPGSYQGSVQLQQQQDQQDQQYRQQQSAPQPGWGSSQGPAARGGAGGPRGGASPTCNQRLAYSRAFAPIGRLLILGPVDVNMTSLFDIRRKPTAAERPILLQWLRARRYCDVVYRSADPNFDSQWGERVNQLIVALAQGQLTYGEFNYKRAMTELERQRVQNQR